jgi:hypothetical protein
MAPIPAAGSGSINVFSLQNGDLTTLVAIFTDEDGEIRDIRVKHVSW